MDEEGGPHENGCPIKKKAKLMTQGKNKRASRRVRVNIPAGYSQKGRAKGAAEIVELGAGGCTLTAPNLHRDGPEVFIHFRIGAEQQEVHLRAHVVYVTAGVGAGLEFFSVSPEGRELLRQYVEEKVAELSGPGGRP
jgi:PilZ domain-containing protein